MGDSEEVLRLGLPVHKNTPTTAAQLLIDQAHQKRRLAFARATDEHAVRKGRLGIEHHGMALMSRVAQDERWVGHRLSSWKGQGCDSVCVRRRSCTFSLR